MFCCTYNSVSFWVFQRWVFWNVICHVSRCVLDISKSRCCSWFPNSIDLNPRITGISEDSEEVCDFLVTWSCNIDFLRWIRRYKISKQDSITTNNDFRHTSRRRSRLFRGISRWLPREKSPYVKIFEIKLAGTYLTGFLSRYLWSIDEDTKIHLL